LKAVGTRKRRDDHPGSTVNSRDHYTTKVRDRILAKLRRPTNDTTSATHIRAAAATRRHRGRGLAGCQPLPEANPAACFVLIRRLEEQTRQN
jgi:hypothetical protein